MSKKIRISDDNDLKYLDDDEKEEKIKKRNTILTEENSDIKAELEYITE